MLNFASVNEDYVDLGVGKVWIEDKSNYSYEVLVSNLPTGLYGIFGQNVWGSQLRRWGIYMDNSTIRIVHNSNTYLADTTITNGIITVNVISGVIEMLFDGVVVANGVIDAYLEVSVPEVRMLIGAYNDADGITPRPNLFATGTVHWAKIISFGVTNLFSLDEGSGIYTTTSEGDVGEIKTSNAGGVTYINDVMWEEDV